MLNIICKNSVKRYKRGALLLGSRRSCLQLHGNEALPKASEALNCSSNTILRVQEWMGDLGATFTASNSRNCRATAFLSLIDTEQESSEEPVDLEQLQRAPSPSKGGDLGTKPREAARSASAPERVALEPVMGYAAFSHCGAG